MGTMISKLNAKQFLEMIIAGKNCLGKHVSEVNAFNEFPTPDHDTGTNMLRTMMSTVTYAGYDLGDDKLSLGEFAIRISIRISISARGKSGTVLAIFFVGFVEPLEHKPYINSRILMQCFQNAYVSMNSYHQSHANCIPDIMQIMEKMVDAAERISEKNDLGRMMHRIINDAQEHVKKNNITDAGCIGLLHIIEGMYLSLCDK